MPRRRPRLIFVHVPKTGGTSLVAAIEAEYGSDRLARLYLGGFGVPVDQFLRWPRRRLRQVRAVTGHFEYGLAALLPGRSVYATVLRDPVERLVSHYYYVLTEPSLVELHSVRGTEASLEAHVTRSPLRHLINDAQTRQLGGEVLDPERPVSTASLERAMQRIDKDFTVVGIQERLDESLLLMQSALGWREHALPRLNVTKVRPTLNEIDPELRAVVLAHNELDATLYEHACARFEHQLVKHGLPTPDGVRSSG